MARTTYWHPRYYELLRMRKPSWVRIHTEVPLSEQASQADMVFENLEYQKTPIVDNHDIEHTDSHGNKECILNDLWPRLSHFTIAEFKSASRPFRRLDLRRLLRCAMEYHEKHDATITARDQLTVVLFVPRINRPLRREIADLGSQLRDLGNGYATLEGPILYTTLIVALDEVAESEDNDFLRIFTTNRQVRNIEARRWMATWFQGESDMRERELEGYEEAVDTFLASLDPTRRLAGLGPTERLAGLEPAERLAGLEPAERLAGLGVAERLVGLRARDLLEALPESERRDLRALLALEESEHAAQDDTER